VANWSALVGTYGGDDRHRAREDRAHELFVAEREEVLEAAAASRQNDDVDLGRRGDRAQRVDHRVRGERALDESLGDDDASCRKTSADRGEDILLRRSVVAGYEPDPACQERQRALPLDDAFRCELLLQALERGEVVSEPEPLDRERAHAEIAACLKELGSPEDVDPLTVGEAET